MPTRTKKLSGMKEDGSEVSPLNIKRRKKKAKEKDSVQHGAFFNRHRSKL